MKPELSALIGVADFETVALVTAGLTGKVWRAKVGGEWPVASLLVGRMCGSAKCRVADDLVTVCEYHPDYEAARLDLTLQPLHKLISMTASVRPLPERAIALWFAVGTHDDMVVVVALAAWWAERRVKLTRA